MDGFEHPTTVMFLHWAINGVPVVQKLQSLRMVCMGPIVIQQLANGITFLFP